MQEQTNFYQLRKNAGLSQEDVAQQLRVSRRTISKWELGQTTPDLQQAKRLAERYRISLDELAGHNPLQTQIARMIENTTEAQQREVDWTAVWSKQYPVLAAYPNEVPVDRYARPLRQMLDQFKAEHGYSEQDACLVLKDILSHVWNPDE